MILDPGGDIEPGTIWLDEINVEVLEEENTDGGYHDGYIDVMKMKTMIPMLHHMNSTVTTSGERTKN